MQAHGGWQGKSGREADATGGREPQLSSCAETSREGARAVWVQAVRSSVMMEKFVIEDGSRQRVSVLDIVHCILDTNQPSLAKYIAVFLPGDFFRHLEDQ